MALQWISGLGLLAIAAAALGVAVVRDPPPPPGPRLPRRDARRPRRPGLPVPRRRPGRSPTATTHGPAPWAPPRPPPSAARSATFVAPAAVEGVRALLDERGDDDGESRRETKLRHVDGRVVFEQWWDRVVVGADGRRELLCVGRDVTERALVENRLADSERQHRELIERLPLAAFVRRDRRLVFANQAAADLVGLDEPDQLLDMTLDSLFTPDGLDVLEERIARRVAGQPVEPIVRARGRTIAGDIRTVDIYTAPIELDGEVCTLAVVNDVTDLVDATSALSRSEERFRALADRSTDVIFRVVGRARAPGRVREPGVHHPHRALRRRVHRPPRRDRSHAARRARGRPASSTCSPAPRALARSSCRSPTSTAPAGGSTCAAPSAMSRDGSLVVDGTLRDVTVEKSLEETLRDLANVDELTGLPNRRALEDELDRRILGGGDLSLLFLDLDRFKDVNDTLGHLDRRRAPPGDRQPPPPIVPRRRLRGPPRRRRVHRHHRRPSPTWSPTASAPSWPCPSRSVTRRCQRPGQHRHHPGHARRLRRRRCSAGPTPPCTR